MISSFHSFPNHSRVWIYQSTRTLSENEVVVIKDKSATFLDQWTTHGHSMNAAIDVVYSLFIVIIVDEQTAPASGCGIDKAVRFIQELEKDLSIKLLDRTQVAYKQGDKLMHCSLNEFEKLLTIKSLDENTIVFNNLVTTKSEMDSIWKLAVKESWHNKYQPNKNILL